MYNNAFETILEIARIPLVTLEEGALNFFLIIHFPDKI